MQSGILNFHFGYVAINFTTRTTGLKSKMLLINNNIKLSKKGMYYYNFNI